MSGTTPLSDLCELVTQQINPADVDAAVVYLGLEHLGPGRMRPLGIGRASDVQSHKYVFRFGDVLYSKLRPYLDKAVLADTDGVCTTELLVFRPKPGVDPRFLACLVHAPEFVEHAISGVTGAHHPRTSWAHVSEFSVISLDEHEQRAIGNVLWRVHDLLIACGSAEQTAQYLKRAAMRELFTRGLRGEPQKETEIGLVPESWRIAPMNEVATLERGRFLHRPRNEPRFYGGRMPFIQTGDVVRSEGRIREFTQTLNEDGIAISRVFSAGTILITIAANIGFSGVLEFDAACPDSLVAISPFDGLNNQFLNFFLQTQQLRMDREAPKGTQKNINIQFLSPWPVPVPPDDEQAEIVAILDPIDRKIELHQKKRAVLEELFRALLHMLMTGEIRVDQLDPSALAPQQAACAACALPMENGK